MMSLDWQVFRALNSLAGRWPPFDGLVQFLMNDYALTTALTVLLVALWFRGRTAQEREADQATVVYAIMALLLASAVVKGMNLLFFRQRPFTAHDGVTLLFYYPSDSSLPSNSAIVAFVFAASLYRRSLPLGIGAYALAMLLGLARIVGGVHYPLDIAAGAALGMGFVALVWRIRPICNPVVRAVRALADRLLLA
ncbi:MAG: phosphatase PAP2 family protein [Anaerolineae bacterium]